jgi:hypothetical protein
VASVVAVRVALTAAPAAATAAAGMPAVAAVEVASRQWFGSINAELACGSVDKQNAAVLWSGVGLVPPDACSGPAGKLASWAS